MIFLCRIRGHGFLSREERYYAFLQEKAISNIIIIILMGTSDLRMSFELSVRI